MPILAPLLLDPPPAQVMPFADGKRAAFSLEFDDAMTSQIRNALPLLAQYRFPATFYINPGRGDYQADVWERQVPRAGHELGNHTWNHGDAVGAEAVRREIEAVVPVFERVDGGRKLRPFAVPGGVRWEVSDADLGRILSDSSLFLPGRDDFYQDGQGDNLRFPVRALAEGSWRKLGMHGVGGQWLSTSVANLADLLRYLDAHRHEIWVVPTGTVWKYRREREAVQRIDLRSEGADAYTLSLRLDAAKLGPTMPYDVPLTLRVETPAGWTAAWVSINGRRRLVRSHDLALQFNLLPRATARIVRA